MSIKEAIRCRELIEPFVKVCWIESRTDHTRWKVHVRARDGSYHVFANARSVIRFSDGQRQRLFPFLGDTGSEKDERQ